MPTRISSDRTNSHFLGPDHSRVCALSRMRVLSLVCVCSLSYARALSRMRARSLSLACARARSPSLSRARARSLSRVRSRRTLVAHALARGDGARVRVGARLVLLRGVQLVARLEVLLHHREVLVRVPLGVRLPRELRVLDDRDLEA